MRISPRQAPQRPAFGAEAATTAAADRAAAAEQAMAEQAAGHRRELAKVRRDNAKALKDLRETLALQDAALSVELAGLKAEQESGTVRSNVPVSPSPYL